MRKITTIGIVTAAPTPTTPRVTHTATRFVPPLPGLGTVVLEGVVLEGVVLEVGVVREVGVVPGHGDGPTLGVHRLGGVTRPERGNIFNESLETFSRIIRKIIQQ